MRDKYKDKKTKIIQTATVLFSEKGFHAASMQEIADASNVSKGTIYTYFSSKDDLLYSIIRYYIEHVVTKMGEAFEEDLTPKEKFSNLLRVLLNERYQYNEFFSMIHQEQIFSKKVKQIFIHLHEHSFNWLKLLLLEEFGEKVRPYIPEGYILFLSILRGYLRVKAYDEKIINNDQLAIHITERVYDLLHAMIDQEVSPILTEQFMHEIHHSFENTRNNDSLEKILKEMTLIVQSLSLSIRETKELLSSIDFLYAEFKKKDPQIFLIKGVLANFSQIKEIAPYRIQIEKFLGL
ncbi:TetR/AcrR family transcriptional regulator [Heyndrickxia oleronia]|uniref:TetR/AcrR family transcriptional regulator n=1 Tax=Heyndrickxia oleronia TaxID=38875 RepID=A0AAW6T1B6_9BACI|nr:TetR/AcrR family transcriptional regulator [Heyndrickxia oleronia]MDH5162514.1 TetR/AcrR family transcriptional regulator [Heyndrickxia oleronia]